MPWYVFALVDEPPSRSGAGLLGRVTARRVPGGFAMVERRADVPPAELGTLQKHQQVVTRLSREVPAILPVRFGTLMEADEIEEALADRDEEIADAFDRVRGRVQFTWRTMRGARGARGLSAAARGAKQGTHGRRDALTGAEYLKRAAARSVPPAAFRAVQDELRPLIAAERYQAASEAIPDSLYHLVDRGSVERYTLIADRLALAAPMLRLTGPFPPFAFTEELL